MKQLTFEDIEYMCKYMLNTKWVPSFMLPVAGYDKAYTRHRERENLAILEILNTCQSKLEVMYFLGIAYYLHNNAIERSGGMEDYPSFYADYPHSLYSNRNNYNGQRGIHISEPWYGYKCGYGESAMMVIPQWKSPDKDIHHDFGIFTASDNSGGPPWYLRSAIEIEGYAIHKKRRGIDVRRYTGLSYTVTTVLEEQTSPLTWYECFEGRETPDQDDERIEGIEHIHSESNNNIDIDMSDHPF